jgi:AAT family amino acid transporter
MRQAAHSAGPVVNRGRFSCRSKRDPLSSVLISVSMSRQSLPATMTDPNSQTRDEGLSIAQKEAGLRREMTSRQVSMLALGGSIGTGLFLGSAIAVRLAGPAVIFSYAAGALIALSVMWALAEMSVVHPLAGSFGVHAEIYLNPWAGFVIRYAYWLAQVVAIGSEVVAASIYARLWFPSTPAWMWIVAFSGGMIYVNARSVGNFGAFEYWFALFKVSTICIFLALGAARLFGIGFPPLGFSNYTRWRGFLPNGWLGVWLGVTMAVFSFLGIEIVAVSAGEAREPGVALPRAMRWTLARLALFYLGGVAVLVGVMPWTQAGLSESPFVRVFQSAGIPAAAAVMNFVVLTAALSSVNANLYLTTRMLFSLSRGGYAPRGLGVLSRRGAPLVALSASSLGMFAALLLELRLRESAYVYMLGTAFFGGLFVWLMILITHISFRRKIAGDSRFVPLAPFGSISSVLGAIVLTAVAISTWWVPGMRITLAGGLPWLAFLTVCYFVWRKFVHRDAEGAKLENHNG